MNNLDKTFELNGKGYKTDSETLEMLMKLDTEKRYDEADMVFQCCYFTGNIVEIR